MLYELSQEHFRHHQRIASVWACIAQSAAAQQAKLPQKQWQMCLPSAKHKYNIAPRSSMAYVFKINP